EQDSHIIEHSFRKYDEWKVFVRKTSRNTKAARKKNPLCDWTVGRWESFGVQIRLADSIYDRDCPYV
ncbi:MAG: hypothetical protein ACK55I_10680, partial [bacterium]